MANPLEVIFAPGVYTNFADLTANQTFSGTNAFSEPIVITKAIGTAPLTVTSTTVNTNLNADLLDGEHLSDLRSDILLETGDYLITEASYYLTL